MTIYFFFLDSQLEDPFMPPFAGTAEELEALVQFILWSSASRPAEWGSARDVKEREILGQIRQWLTEAGTQPGVFDKNRSAESPTLGKAG